MTSRIEKYNLNNTKKLELSKKAKDEINRLSVKEDGISGAKLV